MPSEQLEGMLEIFVWGVVASLLLSYGLVLNGHIEGFTSDVAAEIIATKLKLLLSDTQIYKNTQLLVIPRIFDEKSAGITLEEQKIVIHMSSERTFPIPVKVLNERFEIETATEYVLVSSDEGVRLERSSYG